MKNAIKIANTSSLSQKKYNIIDNVIIFVDDGVFITPFSIQYKDFLEKQNFSRDPYLNVDFSIEELPRDKQNYWALLSRSVELMKRKTFHKNCMDYCKINGLYTIPKETLKKCFLLPETGVEVLVRDRKITYFPIIKDFILNTFVQKNVLCHYSINSNVCIFVNTNGNTYLTRNTDTIDIVSTQYQKEEWFVPLSDEIETLVDPVYKKFWDEQCK